MTVADSLSTKTASTRPLYFCQARIFHRRFRPESHHFHYKVFYLFFPLKAVQTLKRFWLSIDAFNLFSFYHKDHNPGKTQVLPLTWVKEVLTVHHLPWHEDHVWLLTFPRMLGYVFNPISLWFCFTPHQRLYAVIAEVNNTFKEKHSYLLHSPTTPYLETNQWIQAQKIFHVSPFCQVEGTYQFRFKVTDRKIGVWIDYYVAGEKILETSILGHRLPLTNRHLWYCLGKTWWMTVGVMMRIHFQAFKLWRKKVPFYSKPNPPQKEVSS